MIRACFGFLRAPLVACVLVVAVASSLRCTEEPVRATDTNREASPPSPSRPADEFAFTDAAMSGVTADGTYRVRWEPVERTIPDAEPFALMIEVLRADGAPLREGATILVDAEMPHHGHGMNVVPNVERRGDDGRFVAEGLLLHMPGRWIVSVDVEEDGYAERANWNVEIE